VGHPSVIVLPKRGTPLSGPPVQFALFVAGRPQRFWQTRFYDFNVFTDKKRVEKLKYMHRNPVVRRLVADPAQRRWSSYRFYALDEPGPVHIEPFPDPKPVDRLAALA
jgi:hypothetical protein